LLRLLLNFFAPPAWKKREGQERKQTRRKEVKWSTQIRCYLPLVPIALRYSPFQAALYLLEVAGSPSLTLFQPHGV
jgi:hypothetical protein